jgi:hypothetical protein
MTEQITVVPKDSEDPEQQLREQAIADLRKRRELASHTLAYVFVNAFLIVIWRASGNTFFWPMFLLFGWGIGLAFHAWDVLWPEPSEERIRARMTRISRR